MVNWKNIYEKFLTILDFLGDKLKKTYLQTKKFQFNKENITMIIAGICLATLIIVLGAFRIREVEVVGNYYYTKDQIKDMVLKGPFGNNTLFLKYKYMGSQRQLMPLVEEVDVDIEGPDQVLVKVYEKEIIGYIKLNDEYLCIDKDGILVEKTFVPLESMMEIVGVELSSPRLYKKVKTTQPNQMQYARQINEMLKNHHIKPNQLIFDVQKMTLIYQDTKIELGGPEYLQEKLGVFVSIFDKIEGQAGILHMEEYTNITQTVTFEKTLEENTDQEVLEQVQ